jgi:hypothetical protein
MAGLADTFLHLEGRLEAARAILRRSGRSAQTPRIAARAITANQVPDLAAAGRSRWKTWTAGL